MGGYRGSLYPEIIAGEFSRLEPHPSTETKQGEINRYFVFEWFSLLVTTSKQKKNPTFDSKTTILPHVLCV